MLDQRFIRGATEMQKDSQDLFQLESLAGWRSKIYWRNFARLAVLRLDPIHILHLAEIQTNRVTGLYKRWHRDFDTIAQPGQFPRAIGLTRVHAAFLLTAPDRAAGTLQGI
jgi:hypothetical protein